MATTFFDKLIGGLLAVGLKELGDKLKKDAAFKRDLKAFASKCKTEIELEAFALGSKGSTRDLKEHFALENVYIPMRVNQLKPTLGYNVPDPNDDQYEEKPIERKLIVDQDFFDTITLIDQYKQFSAVLIQGDAGAGKSTFMKYLALSFFSDDQVSFKRIVKNKKKEAVIYNKGFKPFYVPVLIRMRE
jgi:hypothetical protein